MAKKKGIRDFATYKVNPYRIDPSLIRKMGVRDKIDGTKEYVPHDTGGIEARYKVLSTDTNWGDHGKPIHLFKESFPLITKLSTAGLKVLVYIFSELRKETDEVNLGITLLMEVAGFNNRISAYGGVIDLLEAGFIAKKRGGEHFFINPNYFFGGSRVRWFHKMRAYDHENADAVTIAPVGIAEAVKKKRQRVEPVKPVNEIHVTKETAAKLEKYKQDFAEMVLLGSPTRTVSSLAIGSFFTIAGTEYLLFLIEDGKYYGADEIAQGIPDDRLKRKFATVFTGSEVIE